MSIFITVDANEVVTIFDDSIHKTVNLKLRKFPWVQLLQDTVNHTLTIRTPDIVYPMLASDVAQIGSTTYSNPDLTTVYQALIDDIFVERVILSEEEIVDLISAGVAGVSTFNGRHGAVILLSSDVTGALGYTPFPQPTGNNAQYITGAGNLQTFPTNLNQFTNGPGYITASSPDTLTNKSGQISMWTNDAGYLTASGFPGWIQGGNSFNALGLLGTLDAYALQLISHAVPGLQIDGDAKTAIFWPNESSSTTSLVQINGKAYIKGNLGIGISSASAYLHLKAGTSVAGTAPIKLTSGTNLTTVEDGAIEYSSGHLYFTIGSTRYQLDQQVAAGSITIGSPITGGTNGSVLFINPSGVLAQNNSNFYWDNTNLRLGIDNNSPTHALVVGSGTTNLVNSQFKIIATGSTEGYVAAMVNNKGIYIGANLDFPLYKLDAYDYSTSTALNVQIGGNGGNILMPVGNVGIGTTPLYRFNVVDNMVAELRFYDNTNNPTLSLLRVSSSGSTTFNIGTTATALTVNSTSGEFRMLTGATWFPTFYSNGTEYMRITTSGIVQVNSTLQVGSTGTVPSGSNRPVVINSNVASNGDNVRLNAINGTYQTPQITFYSNNGFTIASMYGDTNRFYFNVSSSAGVINASSAFLYRLDNRQPKFAVTPNETYIPDASGYFKAIWDGGYAIVAAASSATQTSDIFRVTSYDLTAVYQTVLANGKTSFGTATDLGIGQVQIYGTGSSNNVNLGIKNTSSSNYAGIELRNDGSSSNSLFVGGSTFSFAGMDNTMGLYSASTKGIYLMADGGYIRFAAGGEVEQMRFTTAGNLLINTTTDSGDKLLVNGNARLFGAINTGANVFIGDSSQNKVLTLRAYGDSGTNRYSMISQNTAEGNEYDATKQGSGVYFDDRSGVDPIRLMVKAAGGGASAAMTISSSKKVGIGVTGASAYLQIVNGTGAAGTAAIKLTASTLLTSVEDGAIEYGSSHLWFTIGGTRYQIDQQSIIGATITGGTVGSVLFIGTSSTLSQDNSNFFWDNTNKRLGIGTSSPTTALHVVGNTYISGGLVINATTSTSSIVDIVTGIGTGTTSEYNSFKIRHQNVTNNYMQLQMGVSTTGVGGNNNGYGYINTSYVGAGDNNPLLLNTTGGAVGVGITSGASFPLTVNGTVGIRTTTTTPGAIGGRLTFAHQAPYSANSAFVAGIYDKSSWPLGIGMVFATISGSDISGSTGLERMRITSDGIVGINTTSPNSLTLLDVEGFTRNTGAFFDRPAGALTNYFQIIPRASGASSNFSNAIGNGAIEMSALGAGIIFGTINGFPLAFGTSNAERMRIVSTGNVLVGTTSDNGNKLQVVGNISAYDSSTNGIVINTGTSANPSVDFWAGILRAFIRRTSGDGLEFYTGQGGSNPLNLLGNGNVLIGTTTDNGNKLHVSGNISVSGGTTIGSDAYLTIGEYTGNFDNIVYNADAALIIGVNLAFKDSSNKNTLVTPKASLINASGIVIGGNSSSLNNVSMNDIGFFATPSSLTTAGGTYSNDPRMIIKSGGNILIGTTSDNGNKLQVNGSVSFNNGFIGSIMTVSSNTTVNGSYQVYVIDTSGGNITINVDPSTLGNLFFEIKKKGTDANTVTISMTTGSIYADNGAQSSFAFNNAGGSASIRLDGTNAYVV